MVEGKFVLPIVIGTWRECRATPGTPKTEFYKCSSIKATSGHGFPIHKEFPFIKIEKVRRLNKF